MRKIDTSHYEKRKRNGIKWDSYCKKSLLKQEHMEDNVCHIQISARFLWFVGCFFIDFTRKKNAAVKIPLFTLAEELSKRADGSEFQTMNHRQGISSSCREQEVLTAEPQWVIFLLPLVSVTSIPLLLESGFLLIKLQFGNKTARVSKLFLLNV